MAIDKNNARNGKKPKSPEYTELVRVAHAANLPEAELMKAELEAHGIPAMLEGEGAGVLGVPDLGAGVPVLVPEEFAKKAAELIAKAEAAGPDDEDDEDEDEDNEEGDDEDDDDADEDDEEPLDDEDEDEDEDMDEDDPSEE